MHASLYDDSESGRLVTAQQPPKAKSKPSPSPAAVAAYHAPELGDDGFPRDNSAAAAHGADDDSVPNLTSGLADDHAAAAAAAEDDGDDLEAQEHAVRKGENEKVTHALRPHSLCCSA